MSASVIRILGRVEVQLPKNWPDNWPTPEIQANLFVCFSAGDYEGSGKVTVKAVGPEGNRFPVVGQDATLLPNQNTNLTASIKMGGARAGIHWFEVYWNEILEAKVPLLIQISKTLPDVPQLEKLPGASGT